MKVALVIENLDVARGGRETSTAQIASGLADQGCEVTVLCHSGSCMDGRVSVRELGPLSGPRWMRARKFAEAVRREIGREKFDIVHAMLPLPGANVYQPRGGTMRGQRVASLRRRRGVFSRLAGRAGWVSNLSRWVAIAHERRMLADGKVACLCVSEMVAREFHELYSRHDGVRVIFNAVDVPTGFEEQASQYRDEFRRYLHVQPGDVVFMTVAKNFALKGVRETILAFGRLVERLGEAAGRYRLVLIGERNSHDEYHRLAESLSLDGKVIFIPHEDNVFVRYPAADVCVLLSWYDPCSRVILEAIRCGIPSITTACNGAGEVLAGGAGLVVDSPGDIEAAASAMGLMADPFRRQQCVHACRKISECLGMGRHVSELMDAYREVLSKS